MSPAKVGRGGEVGGLSIRLAEAGQQLAVKVRLDSNAARSSSFAESSCPSSPTGYRCMAMNQPGLTLATNLWTRADNEAGNGERTVQRPCGCVNCSALMPFAESVHWTKAGGTCCISLATKKIVGASTDCQIQPADQ